MNNKCKATALFVSVLLLPFMNVMGSMDDEEDPWNSELQMEKVNIGSLPGEGISPSRKETCYINDQESYFIENMGQIPDIDIKFYSRGGNIIFTPTGVIHRFRELEAVNTHPEESDRFICDQASDQVLYRERGVVLKYSFVDADPVIPVGRTRCDWNTNYFKGSDPDEWFTGVPNYMDILYHEVWPGIDILYHFNNGILKYDIIISPGADPSSIGFTIEGHDELIIDGNGDLVIITEYCDVMDTGLIAFYERDHQTGIEVSFDRRSSDSFGFDIGSYNGLETIVIDPLMYSTFLGGSSYDYGYAIAVDSDGCAYVTGYSNDDTTDYPTTTGAYNTIHNGGADVFVTKMDPSGSSLNYSSFLGGSGSDYGRGIAVDENGSAYITGYSLDNITDFPTTTDAYDPSHNGGSDVFVTKLSHNGSSLDYSTFLGGTGHDYSYGIEIDSEGHAFITGYTNDNTTDFPTTTGAYDTIHNGDYDVFVTKLGPSGSSLVFSTFIGGTSSDVGRGLALDPKGNVYITGYTSNGTTNYPTTSGAFDTTIDGYRDVIVTKLNRSGSSIDYSTFIGGNSSDYGYAIDVDLEGHAFITGYTMDNETTYPITTGAYDTTHNGGYDAFVTKFDTTGSSLNFSTFLGGSASDYGYGITIDPGNDVYITGYSYDSTNDYPTTAGADDTIPNGGADVIVTRLSSNGSSLKYSTFLGGSGGDYGYGIAFLSNHTVYITGYTYDSTTDYPTTTGSYDTSHNGRNDVFVTKLMLSLDLEKPEFGNDLSGTTATTGDPFNFSIEVMDNACVYETYVEYWYGSRPHLNVSMTCSGTFTYNITILSGTLDVLHYIFHARDHANNWVHTIQVDIPVSDNDAPIFEIDKSDTRGSSGDPFKFSVRVVDNLLMAGAFVEYWFEGGTHVNWSMEGAGTYSHVITIPENISSPLHYIFHAVDSSGNWENTDPSTVVIEDDDVPVFGRDLSSLFGTTGDEFHFSIDVTDNIEVLEVHVEYWFSDEDHCNLSLSGNISYEGSISIPVDLTGYLHYIFHATDTAGNPNRTSQINVQVLDDEPPFLGPDLSDESGTTGDEFIFNITAWDNIGLKDVYVHYWYGTGNQDIEALSGSGTYTLAMDLRSDTTEDLHYFFNATDTAGNFVLTSQVNCTITDNDAPVMKGDWSGGTYERSGAGDQLEFKIKITDNIGISGVFLEYWFEDDDHTNLTMTGTSYYYHYLDTIIDRLGKVHYIVRACDLSGIWATFPERYVSIVDVTEPVADGGPDRTVEKDTWITFNGSGSSDEIGVTNFTWTFNDGTGMVYLYGREVRTKFYEVGDYTVNLYVRDDANNFGESSFSVEVLEIPTWKYYDLDGLKYIDDENDDYHFFFKTSDQTVVESCGSRGRSGKLDITSLEGVYDNETGDLRVSLCFNEYLSKRIPGSLSDVTYYLCFVDEDFNEPGDLSEPAAYTEGGFSYYKFDTYHTPLVFIIEEDGTGKLKCDQYDLFSFFEDPEYEFNLEGNKMTLTLSVEDLRAAGVRSGMGLYAMSTRFKCSYNPFGMYGNEDLYHISWDSVGCGSRNVPSSFNENRWEGLFGTGIFGSAQFDDLDDDDYTFSYDRPEHNSEMVLEKYGVKGKFPDADISYLNVGYDNSMERYSFTMEMADRPDQESSEGDANRYFYFVIGDDGYSLDPQEFPSSDSPSLDNTIYTSNIENIITDFDHIFLLVTVHVGSSGDIDVKVKSIGHDDFDPDHLIDGDSVSVYLDRSIIEDLRFLRRVNSEFSFTGELGYLSDFRLVGLSIRDEVAGTETGSVRHISWDTAGTGSVASPSQYNLEKWENNYDRNIEEDDKGNSMIWIIFVILIVAVLGITFGIPLILVWVIIRIKRKEIKSKEEPHNNGKETASTVEQPEPILEKEVEKERKVTWTKEDQVHEMTEQEKQEEYEKLYGT